MPRCAVAGARVQTVHSICSTPQGQPGQMLRSTAEISSFGDEQAANRAAGGTVLSSDGPSSQDGAVEEEEEEETVANLMDAGQELLMSRQVCCFNDVDLVLSSHATAGRSLVRNCPSRSALPGKRAEARETCLLRYEEHHTDQASVADPTQYAFCWGLKFKMPTQIQDQIQDATKMKSTTMLAKLARLEHARRTCGQGEGNAFCCNGWNASVLRLCTAAQWKCYRGLEKQDQGVIQAVCHTQVCFSHTLG